MKTKDILPPETIKPYSPTEGPILYTFNERNFTLNPAKDDEGRKNWMVSRMMYQWRQLVHFRHAKALVIGALPASDVVDRGRDNERDERINEIISEWVQLENCLVASALNLSDPKEASWIKSLPVQEKLKIISYQDRLNGFDLISHLAEIEIQIDKHKKFTKEYQEIIEQKAEWLAEVKYQDKLRLEAEEKKRLEEVKSAKKSSRTLPRQR
jgi:hypothetical protein